MGLVSKSLSLVLLMRLETAEKDFYQLLNPCSKLSGTQGPDSVAFYSTYPYFTPLSHLFSSTYLSPCYALKEETLPQQSFSQEARGSLN